MNDGRERSPSRWHDDASDRDAGHDAMQMLWLKVAQKDVETAKGNVMPAVWTGAEYPFIAAGRIIGFADIATRFQEPEHDDKQKTRDEFWIFYELKPRIYSVGAVIRQVIATEYVARRHFKDWRGARPSFAVVPVVYRDDPKLEMLREMFDGQMCACHRVAPGVEP
jgi:hypothetical protein